MAEVQEGQESMSTLTIVILCLAAVLIALLLTAVCRALALEKKKAVYEAPAADSRADRYAEKLSRMVACETVSAEGADLREKFLEFHQLLAELFPLVHEKLEKTEIDGNLLFAWTGRNAGRRCRRPWRD